MRKRNGWVVFSLLAILWACQKDVSPGAPDPGDQIDSNASGNGARLSYGDTLFYLRNIPAGDTVLPVSRPSAPGFFRSIPAGLVVDSVTGRINIALSETGLRYKIYYVTPAGTALDSVKLVISGIDYRDAIFQIAGTPVAYDTAFPVYNARSGLALPCGDDDEDDDGDIDDDDNKCVFDETDLDDDGNDDVPGVIQDKLMVDIKKGTIDVEASFHAGIFGSSDPASGLSKDFMFYYRLSDASNRALQKITVRIYHFKKLADIPQALLDTLNVRAQMSVAVNSRNPGVYDGRLINLDLYGLKPKRPPIIIIVSQ